MKAYPTNVGMFKVGERVADLCEARDGSGGAAYAESAIDPAERAAWTSDGLHRPTLAIRGERHLGRGLGPAAAPVMDNRWLTIAEAARHLGMSTRALYHRVYRGQVRVHRIGCSLRFSRSDLDAAVEGDLPRLHCRGGRPPARKKGE